MAISFVANALGGTTTTTSFSITLPATQAGDIIILEYTHRGTTDATLGGTYSGPAFTEKHDQQYATSTFSGKTLYSRATGNHSGQTVTGSGLTNSCAAIITVYRGALLSGDPLADATVVGEQNASANETQAQITTATDRAWVVLVVANSPDVAVTAQTCTSPGTLTARAEVLSTGGLDTSIAHASAEKNSAGATGSFTWAQTDGASGSWAYAIKPEPALPRSSLPTSMGPFLPPRRGTGSRFVTLSTAFSVTVPLATLTLTAFAPQVKTPRTIIPPLGTLTLTAFTPTVRLNKIVAVPLGTLTLQGFAPTVLTPRVVGVPLGTLTLTGFAPSVRIGINVSIPLGTLTLTGFAPSVLTPRTISVPLGTLTLTAFAPAFGASQLVQVPLGTLPIVGYEPTVLASGGAAPIVRSSLPRSLGPFLPPRRGTGSTKNWSSTVLAQIPAATLTLTGFAPDVKISFKLGMPRGRGPFMFMFKRGTGSTSIARNMVQVPSGTLTLTAFAPTVKTTATLPIPLGTLTLTAFAPTVRVGATIQVPLATLTLTKFAPTVLANVRVNPPLGTLTLTAFAPSVRTPRTLLPPVGTLTLTAFAPTVTSAAAPVVSVPTGVLVLTAFAPEVFGSGGPGGGGGGGSSTGGYVPMSATIGLRKRRRREEDEPAVAPAVAVEIETTLSQESVAAAAASVAALDAAIARTQKAIKQAQRTRSLQTDIEDLRNELEALEQQRRIQIEEREAFEVLLQILSDEE